MARSKRSMDKEVAWRLLVDEQRRCGLNVRTFCQQKAISEPSFYAWRKELRKRDLQSAAEGDSKGRLIPVDVVKPTKENDTTSVHGVNAPLEIGTPQGFTLRFDHDTAPETISRLLDIIARCPSGGADTPSPVESTDLLHPERVGNFQG